MTQKKSIINHDDVKAALQHDTDFRQPLIQRIVQEVLEVEMEQCLHASKGERTDARLGYRSGYYSRRLITRVGQIELRVPQDRQGHFRTEVFERYQRSEKALVAAMVEMYVQGVSTRKVKAVTEELCGHEFSADAISHINHRLDAELQKWAERKLDEDYPYLILDARYEKVREDGVIRSRAVLIALGINGEGRRRVLAVELANRESATSWQDFLVRLKQRGLSGVLLAITDDHPGLKQAVAEVLPMAAWQRGYVHFLRNARDSLPRKADDDCLTELRWLYDRRDLEEARRDLAQWLERWPPRYAKLCEWVERAIEETFTFYRLPRAHHKHLKSTNLLERLNEELKRRTHVIRIFPNEASCLRLVRALAVEQHEEWLEGARYLDMEPLREERKVKLALAA